MKISSEFNNNEKLYTIAKYKNTYHVFESNNDENNYKWFRKKPLCNHTEIRECKNEELKEIRVVETVYLEANDSVYFDNANGIRTYLTEVRNRNNNNEVCGNCESALF